LGNPYKFHKWNEAKVVDHVKKKLYKKIW
jgi:hypothetical protein